MNLNEARENLQSKRKLQLMKDLRIKSIGELKRVGTVSGSINPELFVYGPENMDLLHTRWSRQELFAIIGDSSSGKTEVALYATVSILYNNIKKRNKEANAIYVSLEMTDEKIAARLYGMKNFEDVQDNFYTISRYDEEGKTKNVSMKWIKDTVTKYKEVLGEVTVLVVDHIHCLGENDASTLNSIMISLKEMAVELNCFVIALAQVNKGAGQKGEVPLDADAVLASSQLKFIASDIMQVHRPIKRFEENAGFSVLGYGYCKIREAHPNDKIKVLQNKLLTYDPMTREFKDLTNEQITIFKEYYNELLELKSAEEKSKAYAYDLTKEIVSANGNTVKIKEIFSGDRDED